MPLLYKTLKEVSVELGIGEAELRNMVQSQKVRAISKRGALLFAPDEIAKIKRQRKSLPESAIKAVAPPPPPTTPKPSPPKVSPPPRKPPPPKRYPPQ